jgi:hypothetical protein
MIGFFLGGIFGFAITKNIWVTIILAIIGAIVDFFMGKLLNWAFG